jgi:hypothetical protein
LIRSLVGLLNVETGFVTTNVITMRLPVPGLPPGSRYKSPEEFKAYLRAIQTAIDAIPGVQHSALTAAVPLTDCCLYALSMQAANRPLVDRANRGGGFFKTVTPSYFASLGLTLRRGRFLDERDRGVRAGIVVNDRLASRYFPGEDPIGQHIINARVIPGKMQRGPDMSWEIVGVVANEKIGALNEDASAVVYASYEQSPTYFANLVVRATVEPGGLEKAIRRALFELKELAVLTSGRCPVKSACHEQPRPSWVDEHLLDRRCGPGCGRDARRARIFRGAETPRDRHPRRTGASSSGRLHISVRAGRHADHLTIGIAGAIRLACRLARFSTTQTRDLH